MKNALIIGLGVSGRASARFLLERGYFVIACDAKFKQLKKDAEVKALLDRGVLLFGEDLLIHGLYLDIAIRSPGIAATHPIMSQLSEAAIPLVGEVELAFLHLKNRAVGITGTNGKTTVTLLVEHILNCAGKKAKALGNVGVPLISAVDTLAPDEIAVIELSSYQLEGLSGSLLEASVLLNITPDHLDRYDTMSQYAAAKVKILEITKSPTHAYVDEETFCAFPELFQGRCCTCIKSSLEKDHPAGMPHDIKNYLAAFALASSMGVKEEQIRAAYGSFKKPAHRIEYVTEQSGIKFFDDSKGTNIDAVIQAVNGMEGFIHLIAGGVDKGASYRPWVEAFKGKVKSIHAIGQAAAKIADELKPEFFVELHQTLDEAVKRAYAAAAVGEVVLLSPGCSSFDMFSDYIERGQAFQKIATSLLPKIPVDF